MSPRETLNRALFRGAWIERRMGHHLLIARGAHRTTLPMFGRVIPGPSVELIELHLGMDLRRPLLASSRTRRPSAPPPRGPRSLSEEAGPLAVVFERDGGWWIATVPDLPGCHTFGDSITRSTMRLRDAAAMWGVAPRFGERTYRVPAEIRARLETLVVKRSHAERASDAARAANEAAAKAMAGAGLSRRDTATLLGISHQRVQQLLDGS